MSLFFPQGTAANSCPFQGIMKEDSIVEQVTGYKYTEVNRPEIMIHHLWSRSGFVNSFDSTSDSNCPNNLSQAWEDSWEYPQFNDFKFGGRTNVVYKIQGVTKDNTGTPIGGITVDLFLTVGDIKVDSTISDAAGNYVLFTPYQSMAHYCVGTNNSTLAGATVNTLVGS